jgi:hypothetical protein
MRVKDRDDEGGADKPRDLCIPKKRKEARK